MSSSTALQPACHRGTWLKIALLALPTWLTSAIGQGRCLGFQGFFIYLFIYLLTYLLIFRRIKSKFTGLSEGSSEQHQPHSTEKKSTRLPLPQEQWHAQASQRSPCYELDYSITLRTSTHCLISFSSAWKWKVKGKSLSRVRLFVTPWQSTRLLHPRDFPGKSTEVGC